MKNTLLIALAAVALAIAFVYGVAQLFGLRMSGGDVYPPYSSLRADPLGAKAYSEALDALPGVQMRRSYREPLPRDTTPETLFFAGVGRGDFRSRGRLPQRIAAGSRAVFTFVAEGTLDLQRREKKPITPVPAKKKPAKKDKKDQPKEEEEDDAPAPPEGISLGELWGVKFRAWHGEKREAFLKTAVLDSAELGLEPELPWHSALYFEELSTPWRVIYSCEAKPVMIARAWGDGTVVLASDSYFLSNEALYSRERSPRLLAWLAGSSGRVVFDEEHHGISEKPGVASLVRKYRLEGVVAGLAVLALLFVWQQAQPFTPAPRASEGSAEVVSGRSSAEGLNTLLRRAIPRGDLLETCLAEWKKDGSIPPPERERMAAAWAELAAAPKTGVVEGYRKLAAALRKGAGKK